MKIFGDVTEQDRSTAQDLEEMESILISKKKRLSRQLVAKGYVCIVYEWYRIGMEEEGNRLLQKIDDVCPEYFQKYLIKHVEEDKTYGDVVRRLFIEFAFLLTHRPESIVISKKR